MQSLDQAAHRDTEAQMMAAIRQVCKASVSCLSVCLSVESVSSHAEPKLVDRTQRQYVACLNSFLQCFDAVGWATGRASGL